MRQAKSKPKNQKSKIAYRVHLQVDEDYAGDAPRKILREAARAALKHQSAASGALTIAISGDETLSALNRRHLGHDHPTDVLSFPSDSDDPDSAGRYFGDVVISYPRAHAQAKAGRHSVGAELQLLVVHGVLHLLGHNHAAPADKTRMWQAQAEILSGIGCEVAGPAE